MATNTTINIQGYQFEGPYTNVDSLQDRSGIYTILDQRTDGRYVIDVGESSEVRTRITNHDRKECWRSKSIGTIEVAVLYTPGVQQEGRKQIEQQLRDKYQPSCGDL